MRRRSVIAAFAALVFVWCGCSSSSRSIGEANGKAALSVPLVGASVEIRDEAGNLLSTSPQPTGSAGVFSFGRRLSLPSRFRVIVRGGTFQGDSFGETLSLDVDGFDSHRLLYVNAVTTLIALYRDRHPGTTVEGAALTVKRFLGIPDRIDPGVGIDNPYQRYFSHEKMISSSKSGTPGTSGSLSGSASTLALQGGITAYLSSLVDEMDSGVATHTFAPDALVGSGGNQDPYAALASQLAMGIVNKATGSAAGWVFNQILASIGLPGTDAQIVDLLNQINQKLDELINLVEQVLSEDKQIEFEIISTEVSVAVSQIQQQNNYLACSN